MSSTLNQYRPVELYLLSEGSTYHINDVIILILTELLSNQVLEVEYVQVGPAYEASRIHTGSAFESYEPSLGDHIFLKPFMKDPTVVLNFNHSLQMALQKSRRKRSFVKKFLTSSKLQSNFEMTILFLLTNKPWLSKDGKRVKEQIKRSIATTKQKIDRLIDRPKKNSQAILELMRQKYYYLRSHVPSNIFGLDSIEIFNEYKKGGYDIHYEMSFDYFKDRLQRAHVAILHMDQIRDKRIDADYDGWST